MSEKNGEYVVRAVRFDRVLWEELDQICDHTGLKAAALHRMALRMLVDEVKETGRLPIPPMPVVGEKEAEGDAA